MCTKRCFFIGHRQIFRDIRPLLAAEVERLISECGVCEFTVGHYGEFDRAAAAAVIAAKKKFPHVRLFMLLPYHPAEHAVELPDGFDGSYYPSGMENVPRRVAIVRANRCAVDRADFLIAYVKYPASGARSILEYARRRASRGLMDAVNLAERDI